MSAERGIRCSRSSGSPTTASNSGGSSSLPPSSPKSSGDTATRLAPPTRSSRSRLHRERFCPSGYSSARTCQPCSTARVMGRTPWTRNSPARWRLVRLVSRACHCWKVALRVLTLIVLATSSVPPRCAYRRRCGGVLPTVQAVVISLLAGAEARRAAQVWLAGGASEPDSSAVIEAVNLVSSRARSAIWFRSVCGSSFGDVAQYSVGLPATNFDHCPFDGDQNRVGILDCRPRCQFGR